MNNQLNAHQHQWFESASFETFISKTLILFVLITLYLSNFHEKAMSEVRIRPSALYLNDSVRSGMVAVTNNGDESIDVTFKLMYGYPKSDSLGNPSFTLSDSSSSNKMINRSWVQVYPQQFVLKPHDWQAVQMTITLPPELKDGEYWIRPVLTVRPLLQQDQSTSSKGTSTICQQFVLLANFCHGSTYTGIAINRIQPVFGSGGKLGLRVDMIRVGNAAYRGTITCNLKNQNRQTVLTSKKDIAVYEQIVHKLSIGETNLPDGDYTVEVNASTDREKKDLAAIIPARSVTKEIAFSIYQGQLEAPGTLHASIIPANTNIVPPTTTASVFKGINSTLSTQSNSADSTYVRAKLLEKRLKQLNDEADQIMKEMLTLIIANK
jgi:hypothetical protein